MYQILQFLKTDIRIERIDMQEIKNDFQEDKEVIVFTDEWILYKPEVKKKLEEICNLAIENNFVFEYPEEIRGINEEEAVNN